MPVTVLCKDTVFVPQTMEHRFRALDTLQTQLADPLLPLLRSLRHNLEAVHRVAGIPMTLSLAAGTSQRLALLSASERILAHFLSEDPEEKTAEAITRRATALLQEELAAHGDGAIVDVAIGMLEAQVQNEAFRLAAQELLRQATVLTWGALEVLSEDLFRHLLNSKPDRARLLRTSEDARRLFSLKSIPFEDLEQRSFDLSHSLGDLLLDLHRIDSIPIMKTVYSALFPNVAAVRESLSQKRLYLLNQRRHLIVHRLGIVDSEYVSNTGDTLEVGAPILIRAADLARYLDAVLDLGLCLLVSANADT